MKTEKEIKEIKKRFDELSKKGIVNLTKEEHEEIIKLSKEINDLK